jgi:dTMP kinase
VFEGIDGSGKSEQARRLAARLEREGRRAVLTREPTDSEWGRSYRAWARGAFEASPEEVLHWFLMDRIQHIEELIRPALRLGDIVVCDRYRDSTLAYQAAQGIGRARLRELFGGPEFPTPDLVLWLRVPIPTALARLGGAERERFEQDDFLARVDAEYEQLGLAPTSGSGSPDEVEARVWAQVEPLLSEREP